jgi:DNA mismatch repair protein MutS
MDRTARHGRAAAAALDRPPAARRPSRCARHDAIEACCSPARFEPCAKSSRPSATSSASWRASRSARPAAGPGGAARRPWPRLPALHAGSDGSTARCSRTLDAELGEHPETSALLQRALVDNRRMLIRDGGVIARGYDAELDELRDLAEHGDQFLLDLEQRERERTGIDGSRSATTACTATTSRSAAATPSQVPDDYQRRQTLKGAERYITPELKRFEDQVLSARERALAREKALYDGLLDELREAWPLQASAAAIADAGRALQPGRARRALDWSPPELTRRPGSRDRGRPPPGGRAGPRGEPFVPNGSPGRPRGC